MKTFLEKVMTVPFPWERSSVAAARSSASGIFAAWWRASSRVRGWSVVCIGGLAEGKKEFNTESTEIAEVTEKNQLAEEVFGGGADDTSSGFGSRLEAIAANEDNGGTLGLSHEETGSSGEFVGDGKDGGRERFAVAVPRTAQIEEHGQTGCAYGDIDQAETPGPAESVTDDDGDAFVRSLAKHGGEILRGEVGIAREQRHHVFARNIRMVHARIGADI